MKFRMNGLEWEIKEVPADEVKSNFKNATEESVYFGCTQLSTQTIFLNSEVSKDKKRQTLYHELMHCYIYCYICDGLQFDEEGMCELSAKSHNMIHEIVEEYFKPNIIVGEPNFKPSRFNEAVFENYRNIVLEKTTKKKKNKKSA